ncbi:hypothetical protein BKA93DRAFT_729222, partial [Sparassis latifolia]
LETVSVCEGIIEEFRKAKLSKAEAFIQLFETLRYQEATSDEEISSKHAAFTIYLAELDEIERALREARNRGRTQVPDTSAVENADSGAPAPEEALEPSSTPVRSSKFDESLFPFTSSTVSALLSPELLRMLKLKENYTRDLSFSKQSITCHPDCPNVPESIWNDVLSNCYVDLDKIYSAFYSVDGDVKQSLKLGDLEVVSEGPSKLSKHISHHGEWTNARVRYQQAVCFAFPH